MALKLTHSATALKLRPPTLVESPAASISLVGGLVLVTGDSQGEVELDDAYFDRYTSPTYYYDGSVQVTGMHSTEFVSLNPEVATISADGTVTKVSDGICRILAKGQITLGLDIDLTTQLNGVPDVDVYNRVKEGSLAAHFSDQVDSRIDNTMTKAANGKVYSTQDHVTPNYVRNPNLWCADVDLTCISPWNSRGKHQRAGTLVTPRHMFNAHHYPLYIGDDVRFVAGDGTVHTRTIVGAVSDIGQDFRIYTLDSDLPAAISPCEVMPSDWRHYTIYTYENRVGALGLDQEEKAIIFDWSDNGFHRIPTDADRLIFSEGLYGGDSGNPALKILNGSLVLNNVWRSGNERFGSGQAIGDFITELNAMIVTADAQAGVSTGYTVTEADFSAFPTY